MSKLRAPKANYKIFDKKTGKYLSGSKKSTWTSRTWVMAAAEDFAFNKVTGFCSSNQIRKQHLEEAKKFLQENIEIHIFPVESAIKVSWHDMLNDIKAENEAKEAKKKSFEEKKKLQELEKEKLEFAKIYAIKQKELKDMQVRAKALGVILPEGTYEGIREFRTFTDEYGNKDWRDTGEMRG